MKPVEQPAEAVHEDYAALADQFLQENQYLPPRDDQSWREQAALRISGRPEQQDDEIDMDDALDMVPVREDANSATDFASGRKGRVLVPLLMAMIIVPTVAVLTAPDILTPGFWRGHRSAEHSPTPPAAPPIHLANTAAPLRPSLAKAPPPPVPAKEKQDLTAKVAAVPPAKTPPIPKAQPGSRTAEVDRQDTSGAGRFRSLVIGPDGALRYEYFSSEPAVKGGGQKQAQDDSGNGFYAMVPDADGTLRYKYFPSKPSR